MPISFLIHTAKAFDCDIYLRYEDKQVNVKSYDELIRGMPQCTKSVMFFFNGVDEQAAEQKIERIFLGQWKSWWAMKKEETAEISIGEIYSRLFDCHNIVTILLL